MALTIISLIKQVPLPSEMRMGDDGLMDRTKAKSIINIDYQFGLEAGVRTCPSSPSSSRRLKTDSCIRYPQPSRAAASRVRRESAAMS